MSENQDVASNAGEAGAGDVERERPDAALARLLVSGLPIAEVARRLEVSRGLIYRRLQSSAFRDLMAEARSEAALELLQKLVALDEQAVKALTDCLSDKAPAVVRLQAVRLLWEARNRLVREVDFASQLEEIRSWMRERTSVETTAKELPT